MAVAFMANAQHLTYRSDLLEQAGVEPPQSYEDVLAAAEAIRGRRPHGNAARREQPARLGLAQES
jgi:ABC-type glycerol-3-phosphate transport system substrate-binding protein